MQAHVLLEGLAMCQMPVPLGSQLTIGGRPGWANDG